MRFLKIHFFLLGLMSLGFACQKPSGLISVPDAGLPPEVLEALDEPADWSGELPSSQDPLEAKWLGSPSMENNRLNHVAVRLNSGKVLVAGGSYSVGSKDSQLVETSEIYDPATDGWSKAGPLNLARENHVGVRLKSGKVMVLGGYTRQGLETIDDATSEIFDPQTETWTSGPSMNHPRSAHAAVLLSSGKVLVVGGFEHAASTSAELYDPETHSFTQAAPLQFSHAWMPAVRLFDGRVLVIGGTDDASPGACEVFDPETETWSVTGALKVDRQLHRAILLRSGHVLVVGGQTFPKPDTVVMELSSEIFDPETGEWTTQGTTTTGRSYFDIARLKSGEVLISGRAYPRNISGAELFDPVSGEWHATTSMGRTRGSHTLTVLSDGSVLAVGGSSFLGGDPNNTANYEDTNSVERYLR